MRRRLVRTVLAVLPCAAAAIASTWGAGCGKFGDADPGDTLDGGGEVAPDASGGDSSAAGGDAADATTGAADATTTDAGDAGDAGLDPTGCPPATYLDGGRIAYALPASAVMTSCPSFEITPTTAAEAKGANAERNPSATATIDIAWSPDRLDVVATVSDPTPHEGSDSAFPYNNDSVELYFGGGEPVGDYAAGDFQLIADWKGLSRFYDNMGPNDDTAFSATVATTGGGYVVTWTIAASYLGQGMLSANQVLYVDAILNDGTQQSHILIWSLTPHACGCNDCGCRHGDPYPHADTYTFSPLYLLP